MSESSDLQLQSAPTQPNDKKWFAVFCILIFVIVIAGFTYGYVELAKINIYLSRAVTALQDRVNQTSTTVMTLQQNVIEMRNASQKTANLLNDWHQSEQGTLTKWHVAEAAYLTRLADHQLQFSFDTQSALAALQNASQLLANVNDDKLTAIKLALATQIKTLQNTPTIDATSIYNQLTKLDAQFQQLPLPATPLVAPVKQAATINPGATWWQRSLSESWAALSKVVIVRRNKTGTLPLVLPEEKTFLYLNLHMEMQTAISALLQHNNSMYQSSLARVIFWIQTYFVQDAPLTQTVLQQLADLQKINITIPSTHVDNLLPLFDSYLATKP